MSKRAILALVLTFSLATVAIAQVPPEERIRITDPDRLEALGFPRGATDIFAWSKADRGGGGMERASAATSEAWGTATGYSTTFGYEFQGVRESIQDLYKTEVDTYCYSGDSLWTFARIDVPDGVKLRFFRFWAYDTDDQEDMLFHVFETCQPAGLGPPGVTLIGESTTFGSIGNYSLFASLHDLTANTRDCGYTVRVLLSSTSAGSECRGLALRLRKFQVSWTRQVSPAPATATFADVPTSHPFFRFVEALVDSGITAGCGNGNYCPNNPISRGEMAVFLAGALGLSWP